MNNERSLVYGPEIIRVLQEVFDAAWTEMAAREGSVSSEEADKRRSDLAQMILLEHRSGLSPEEIKAAVLGQINSAEDSVANKRLKTLLKS